MEPADQDNQGRDSHWHGVDPIRRNFSMMIKTSGADHSMPSKPLTRLQGERAELSLSPAHSQMIFPILNLFFF